MEIERETITQQQRFRMARATLRNLVEDMRRERSLRGTFLLEQASIVLVELDAIDAVDLAEANLCANRIERERYTRWPA